MWKGKRRAPPFNGSDSISEAKHQIALISWATKTGDKRLELLFHIPNGGYRRPLEAVLLKASGLKPGIPDLFLPVPSSGKSGLFIELKKRDGTLRHLQQDWLDRLGANGYAAEVAFGWRHAADIIEKYLGTSYAVDRDAIDQKLGGE